MYKIKIVAVGKIKERPLGDMIGEYVKRLKKYCTIDIIEVADESVSARESDAGIRRSQLVEAGRILERRLAGGYAIALDMGGQSTNSIEFSQKLNYLADHYPEIVFFIGGSHGLHQDVLTRADNIWSMSELTFPHQLARLILVEQIYRAFKIINNETYHK